MKSRKWFYFAILFLSGCGTFQTPDRSKEEEEDLRSIREVRPWSADVFNPQAP
jgi:hypothetical protein